MTIDLRTCRPGDKLKMQNGKVAEYIDSNGDSMYPHSVKMPNGTTAFFTDNGQFYSYLTSSTDIIEILPMQTKSTIPQRGTKEFARYAAETMMAGAAGQDIEFLHINRANSLFSEVVGQSAWNWGEYDYRIKPKPTVILFRQWKMETCPVGKIVRKNGVRAVILAAHEHGAFLPDYGGVGYSRLLTDWTMDNGEPCGTVQQ